MANIFISYGSNHFRNSLNRIGKEAKSTGAFDKIILYTEKDLPEYIKSSPVYKYERGGGYWIWKAYIIQHTLSLINEGDILFYADAGCTLKKSPLWEDYFNLLNKHNAVYFQYKNIDYGWSRFSKYDNPQLKHWIKGSAIKHLNNYFTDQSWLDYNKIMAGVLFLKKNNLKSRIIDEWFSLIISNPYLLVDSNQDNEIETNKLLNEHRHDQALLTAMVYLYKEIDNALIMPESFEMNAIGPIVTSRINDSHRLNSRYNRFKKKVTFNFRRLKSFLNFY